MSDAAFNSFFNKSFGLNIKVPDRTLKQAGQTLGNTANGVLSPLFTYLEENEKIFNGDAVAEADKLFAASFNIGARMHEEDIKVNGETPKFDSKF